MTRDAERLLVDDAGAAREHLDVGTPDADIAPAADAAGAGALVLARAAAEDRLAAAAPRDPLAVLPHPRLRLARGQRVETGRQQPGRAENEQCFGHLGPPSRLSPATPADRVSLHPRRLECLLPLRGSSACWGNSRQWGTRRRPDPPLSLPLDRAIQYRRSLDDGLLDSRFRENDRAVRCERSEPRRMTVSRPHPSRAASRPPQDDD